MTPDERLKLVRLKIERADKHIDCLKTAIQSFINSKPYKVATKRDPDTRKLIYYVESAQPVPVDIATIAGDALSCLRDALDHLAQQLYLVGTGNAQGYRDKTGFPISSSAKNFKSDFSRKVEGMRQDAVDAIRALEPYSGGKGADLWTLHRLNNIDKHRLILTVGTSFGSVDLGAYIKAHAEKAFGKTLPDIELFVAPADNLFPLEAGKELFIGAPDEEPNDKMKFKFDVAINEAGLIEGKPVLETLMQFRDRVNGIVEAFRPCLS
jgi:hypothetical protein